jgi:PX domain
MYGSTEATEDGKPYTEYLMRCQWGTTWDNMQPWIVARRYREFDALDYQLRRSFPSQIGQLVPLPEKSFFSSMASSIVDQRRRTLEDYMSRIVQRLPTVLRSRNIDDFLGISERIHLIRAQLGPDAGLLSVTSSTSHNMSSSSGSGAGAGAGARTGAGTASNSAAGPSGDTASATAAALEELAKIDSELVRSESDHQLVP